MTETTEQSTWPVAIAAITLFVEHLERSKTFYRQAFGLPVAFEDPDSVVFRFGDTLINLLQVAAAPELIAPATVAPANLGSRIVCTVNVDDVDAVSADLEGRGVALLNGPMTRPWGPRTASFSDPDGYIWEIAH